MDSLFREKYPHEAGFSAHFNKSIGPILEDIEIDRISTLKIYKWALFLSYALIALGVAFYLKSHPGKVVFPDALMVGIFLLAVGAAPAAAVRHLFMTRNKSRLMPLIMSFFPDMTYSAGDYLPEEGMRGYLITPTYNRYNGSDLITLPGQFSCSLLHLKYRSSGKKKKTRTTFRGLAILVNLLRPVESQVAIAMERGKLVNWLQGLGKNLQRIPLVDPVFEKVFEVYGNDQVIARKVLAPDVMELFLRLNFLFSDWKQDLDELERRSRAVIANHNIEEVRSHLKAGLRADFKDDKLLMLIDMPDGLFEPISLKESCLDLTKIRATLYQVSLIRQIHGALNKEKF